VVKLKALIKVKVLKMGTINDLFKNNTHDFVDNPYWSAMQIKVKRLASKDEVAIGMVDMGKVLLVANMTLDKRKQEESDAQLKELERVAQKYSKDLAVYSQFSYDVCGGEQLTNREIAKLLVTKGLLTKELMAGQIRFLEKVS